PAGKPGLSARHWYRLAAPYLLVAGEVLRHHWLLEPTNVAIGDGATERHRLDGVVAMVGIEHQADLGSDRLTAGPDQRRISRDPETDFELHGGKALLHVAQHCIDDIA